MRTDSTDGADDGADGDAGNPETGRLAVTLTNTSESQPMTPPVVVLHNAPGSDNGVRLFEGGQPASDGIIAIAENGNNAPLVGVVAVSYTHLTLPTILLV